MSTAAEVRAAWAANVWADTNITAYTENIYSFDLSEVAEISKTHEALTLYEAEVNFIQYQVNKAFQYQNTGQFIGIFPVTVQYFKEAKYDTNGTAYNSLIGFFDALHTSVRSNLSKTWGSTVDGWDAQQEAPEIEVRELIGRPVWYGSYQFIGFKAESI